MGRFQPVVTGRKRPKADDQLGSGFAQLASSASASWLTSMPLGYAWYVKSAKGHAPDAH